MNMAAIATLPAITIERPDIKSSIFTVTGRDEISIRAGTVITVAGTRHAFDQDTPIDFGLLAAGHDYAVRLDLGRPVAVPAGIEILSDETIFGGFHFAPGGNAPARAGGDTVPAINPSSCWDAGFRPVCPDPRGMALVDGRFWVDIYLLAQNHLINGTSRCGATIADGVSLPSKIDGEGRYDKLDYAVAVEIYAHHGKQLLGAEEFFASAYGVTERKSRGDEPEATGEIEGGAAAFTSKWGIFDVTGTMWQWGTDGDPDNPRASIFGGSWFNGSNSGSRCAYLVYWPGHSDELFSARGRSDHSCLTPA
nr:hypothetical protein 4 [bacterium]